MQLSGQEKDCCRVRLVIHADSVIGCVGLYPNGRGLFIEVVQQRANRPRTGMDGSRSGRNGCRLPHPICISAQPEQMRFKTCQEGDV